MPNATSLDGTTIAYDDEGSAEVVLLGLPGWCIERSIFSPLLERAGARRRVLALDWRGHGGSTRSEEPFGAAQLVEDALAVIEASGARRVVPIAQAHAGWIAIELAERLGDRVPAIVATSWMMFAPPPPFTAMLAGLQDPERWSAIRDTLVGMWLQGAPAHVDAAIRSMTSRYGADMWARGAREIASAFEQHGTATAALGRLRRRAVHLYAQPRAPEVLAAHEAFGRDHSWFRFARLDGATHFPTLETPDAVLDAVERLID